MSRWVQGKDLMKEWKITELDLFERIQSGLQPHNSRGEPIPPPDIAKKLDLLKRYENERDNLIELIEMGFNKVESLRILEKRNNIINDAIKMIAQLKRDLPSHDIFSWENYQLPETPEGERAILDLIKDYYFNKPDVIEHIKLMKDKLPDEVISFFCQEQLHLEIEQLYQLVKKRTVDLIVIKWTEAIREYIQKHNDSFKLIRSSYLTQLSFHGVSPSNGRRDIISPMLQLIVAGSGLGKQPKVKLYDEYREYERQKKGLPTNPD